MQWPILPCIASGFPSRASGLQPSNRPTAYRARSARDVVSFALGCSFHRWQRPVASFAAESGAAVETGGVPLCARALSGDAAGSRFLVDDPGASTDLIGALDAILSALSPKNPEVFKRELLSSLGCTDLREYLRPATRGLFDDHLKRYTGGRRAAPIYWQLGIPSGRYSVWLYAHRLRATASSRSRTSGDPQACPRGAAAHQLDAERGRQPVGQGAKGNRRPGGLRRGAARFARRR